MSTTYQCNEVFYSIQGEGVRVGTPNIFIRFSGCNMRCDVAAGPKSPGGFACDTEFTSGRLVTLDGLHDWVGTAMQQVVRDRELWEFRKSWQEPWLILTGGEPGLQVDAEFIQFWHGCGWKLAIETNGTIELPEGFDWITLSPKVAEHAVKQLTANELKYVRGWGQGIPKPTATADHYLISPAADGYRIDPKTVEWCTKLCLENPPWRLSLQTHKFLDVR